MSERCQVPFEHKFDTDIYVSLGFVLLAHLILNELMDVIQNQKRKVVKLLRFALEAALFILGFGFSYIHLPLYIGSFVLAALLLFSFKDYDWYRIQQGGLLARGVYSTLRFLKTLSLR